MSRQAFCLLVCLAACERRGAQQTAVDARAADGLEQDAAATMLPNGSSFLTRGQTCSADSVCGSGFCVDGVCCDTRCEGKCRRCDLAGLPGTCGRVPAGSAPRAGDCSTEPAASCGFDGNCDGEGACRRFPLGTSCGAGGTCVDVAVVGGLMICNGSGQCVSGPAKICNPLTCDPTTGDCRASCTTDDHCVNRPCRNGACYRPPAPCQQDNVCASGHCAQNVCCNEACDRPGFSCALPSSPGICAPVPDAAAPDA